MKHRVSCIAGGDIFISRRLPALSYPGFEAMRSLICRSELRFANLEILFHELNEGIPAFCTGTHAMCTPDAIEDVTRFGFNLFSSANNHAMDYSHSGLTSHLEHLRKKSILHSGAGVNLAAASAPVYFECSQARVALVSACSTFDKTWAAGEQNGLFRGRPGLNPLGHSSICYVTSDQMRVLREISDQTELDGQHECSVKEGFAIDPADGFYFGGRLFKIGDHPHEETAVDRADAERILASIREGRRQADYVIVSLHCHEQFGRTLARAPQFLEDFSRACIDAGASIVLGHGPHQVRGIEVYRGGVIFYSLGNLIFENDTVSFLPPEFYRKYGLPADASVGEGIDRRNHNGTTGFAVNPLIWESVMASWTFEDKKISDVKLYPISLGFEQPRYLRGLPVPSQSPWILEYIQTLSAPYGTEIIISDTCATVCLKC